ncbi:FAD/NAD(P)-binding domain-containing protein [Dendrothele bispora CBS 962.96]|uniref:FAD/NAD(P)-binding domain-containing protein n=1 Tax=Dendrothele bispora (strain CBS 962.96) TaxID=1314807 RepID=A0A4S8KZ61_DENBC|nr:FAD/NAD(P)-binding domain-containing protein [Dendrothele bispora CBS 962.96]
MHREETPVRPKRVLIIGGGPAGLITLRNLTKLGTFERVELVERRDDVGGVWYLGAKDANSKWPSPAYPGLIGNVLPEFLSVHDFPFPPPDQYDPEHRKNLPFPTLTETYDYLRAFAKPFLEDGRIRLGQQVVKVEETLIADGSTKDKWLVLIRDWNDPVNPGVEREEKWDAIVGCTGWYDNLVWPETEGLDALREKKLAVHAKGWNGPEGLEGKRVLIIGNANSSNDIASQLAPVAMTPIYRSIRRPNFPGFVSLPDERIENVPPVKRYMLTNTDKVKVELENGRIIDNIDIVFVGTGYKPHVDFVHVLPPPLDGVPNANGTTTVPLMSLVGLNAPTTLDPSDSENANSKPALSSVLTNRIPLLHRHILYAPSPSLAFILSMAAYTPFTIADVSSCWLALAWSTGKGGEGVEYPKTLDERLKFERERMEAIEKGRREIQERAQEKNDQREKEKENATKAADVREQHNTGGTTSETFSPSSSLIAAWQSGTNGHTPSALNLYSVLAVSEEDYAQGLKEDVVKARPELGREQKLWDQASASESEGGSDNIYRHLPGGGLPEWNLERRKKREEMYPIKLASLKWAREKMGERWTNREGR